MFTVKRVCGGIAAVMLLASVAGAASSTPAAQGGMQAKPVGPAAPNSQMVQRQMQMQTRGAQMPADIQAKNQQARDIYKQLGEAMRKPGASLAECEKLLKKAQSLNGAVHAWQFNEKLKGMQNRLKEAGKAIKPEDLAKAKAAFEKSASAGNDLQMFFFQQDFVLKQAKAK